MEVGTVATSPEHESIKSSTKPRKRLAYSEDRNEVQLKKQKRSEQRRLRRRKKVMLNKVCFNCRESGHTVASCSKFTDEATFGICFRCGSAEHKLQKCKVRVKGLPYARCFICGGQGHLAKSCQENPKGIYPLGGQCQICNGVDHLARDCDKRSTEHTARRNNDAEVSGSENSTEKNVAPAPAFLRVPPLAGNKKRRKVVKF